MRPRCFPPSLSYSVPGNSGASMAFRRIMERAGVAAGIARKAEDGSAGRNVPREASTACGIASSRRLLTPTLLSSFGRRLAGHASEGKASITHIPNSRRCVRRSRSCRG